MISSGGRIVTRGCTLGFDIWQHSRWPLTLYPLSRLVQSVTLKGRCKLKLNLDLSEGIPVHPHSAGHLRRLLDNPLAEKLRRIICSPSAAGLITIGRYRLYLPRSSIKISQIIQCNARKCYSSLTGSEPEYVHRSGH